MSFRMNVRVEKVLEDGAYDAKLVNVEQKETKFGNRLMWTFEVLGEDTEVVGFTSTSPSTKAKAYQWASAIIGEIDPKLGWGPEDVIGGECVVVLETAEDAQGVEKNKVVKLKRPRKGTPEAVNTTAKPDGPSQVLIGSRFNHRGKFAGASCGGALTTAPRLFKGDTFMLADFENVLDKLEVANRNGEKAMCFCPAHDDRNNPSLSVKAENGRLLVHCFAGCRPEDVVSEMGLEMKDLFVEEGGGSSIPPCTPARLHAQGEKPHANEQNERARGDARSNHGCTLKEYSEEKKLPEDFLRGLGLRDVTYLDKPAVRIPYPDEEGQEIAVRFRVSLDGAEKFRWRSGDKPVPYGLKLLGEARKAGFVVLVEGESDCHTLWYHEIPALGIPGVSNWRDGWATYLDGIEKVYAVIEPDQGGETLREKLTACEAIKSRLHLVELGEHKDPSALHLADPDRFRERLEAFLEDAKPWIELERAEAEAASREAWERCQKLAEESDILGRFAEELARSRVAGESRVAKLLYLGVTSRLLERPVSVALKGPSSGGKSFW